jgi:hypothetical protein
VRGLPPPDPNVVFVEAVWDVGPVQECTTGWHLFAPGADSATFSELETLLGQFFLFCVPDLLDLLGTDVSCSTLRLTSYGSEPLVVSFVPSSNVGATGTTNPINSALVLTWRTGLRGASGLGHTWLPLSDTFVDDDHARLKSIAYSQAASQAFAFLGHVNALISPDGATCFLAVIRRSLSGTPLHTALTIPVEGADASPFVGTLRRRVRARRPSSSPF